MTTSELLRFMRLHRLAVQASASPTGEPQAAVVGIAVTDAFELIFDAIDTTRKIANLRRNSRVAFVIGGLTAGDERTVQCEGVADQPEGAERDRIKSAYFEVWPDGHLREKLPGQVYIRVRPTWIRFSDFNQSPPSIVEFDGSQLR